MISIHPQYLPLSKLLNGRLFRIPEYQRAYSWTKHQRQDLFEDIEKVYKKGPDAGHFMAAVVCLRRKKQTLGTDDYYLVEVVDGQQRLTTLVILLNAIKAVLSKSDKSQEKLFRELSELLVKLEGNELLLLQTNHDASHFYEDYIRKDKKKGPDTATTIADKEILSAIEECSAFVSHWVDQGRKVEDLAALLKNRLFFLLHEIEDEAAVYTVFEVLNSRGLPVSWLDRLKSILMGKAFELKNVAQDAIIADLHKTWRDIYAIIGLRQGFSTEALRFAATLKMDLAPSRPLSEEDAVELLRSRAIDAKSIRETASWLLSVVRACDEVISSKRRNAVTRIVQARLLAVSIQLHAGLKPKEVERLLSDWEKVSFRIYGMMRKDARTGVGDYVRLAWRSLNEKLSADEIKKGIAEIGSAYPIKDAVAALTGADCYSDWQQELRYFFYRYEEYLAGTKKQKFKNEQWERIWLASPSESIEHINPQSKAPEKYVHSLGNLLLLPPRLNSQLNNDPPKQKVTAYRKTGLLIANGVADQIEHEGWSAKTVSSREKELLDWAATEWAN